MDDFEDNISDPSSIASYPSSPGNISQNLPGLENPSDILDIDLGGDRSRSYRDFSAKAKAVDTAVMGMGHTGGTA